MAAATPSRRLLDAIKRSKANPEVPISKRAPAPRRARDARARARRHPRRYDRDAMSSLKDECNERYKEILRLMEGGDAQLSDLDDGVKAALVVHHQTILRNKQCAQLYIRERMTTLRRLRLEAGAALPEEIRNNMGQEEKEFFDGYDKLYSSYMRDMRVDLRTALRPPKDLYIQVRCNADCGELVTTHSGVVKLDKGTTHFLRAADVEPLVSQGLVEHIRN